MNSKSRAVVRPLLSIGQVAKKSGLRSSAIRYYERAGLLPAVERVNGWRRYDQQALERLAIVLFARRVGFRLSEIRFLLDGFANRPPPVRWRAMAQQKIDEVDAMMREAATIKALLVATLRHKCPKLAERGVSVAPQWVAQGRKTLAFNNSPAQRKTSSNRDS